MTAMWRRLNLILLLAALGLALAVARPSHAPAYQDAPKDDGAKPAPEQREDADRRDDHDEDRDRDDHRGRRGPDGRDSHDGDGRGPFRTPWSGLGGDPPQFPGTDEAVAEALTVFKDLNPYIHGRLVEQQKENPEKVKEHIKRMWPFLHTFIELKKTQPELYGYKATEARTGMATRYYAFKCHRARREGKQEEAAEAERQLRELAREHFEARMAIREYELEQLKEQLDTMESKLKDMRQEKEKHIEEQIARLLTPPQRRGRDEDRDGDRR